MQSHIPSQIIPLIESESAESKNRALANAVSEVAYIRRRAEDGREVCAGDIADAFEAVLNLVAPHWRGLPCGDK